MDRRERVEESGGGRKKGGRWDGRDGRQRRENEVE